MSITIKPEISQEKWNRFIQLRQDLFVAIKLALEEDDYCKSDEGVLTISYSLSGYFEAPRDSWTISLNCYVVGPGRTYRWYGATFSEALDAAEKAIMQWIAEQKGTE